MTILEPAVLVFQQTKNIMKNDFAIMDGSGAQVAHVETGGSTLGRMFAGSRHLTVFDGPENPVLQVKDTMGIGRDRMEILDGQGAHLASLVKRITFFKTRVTLDYQGEDIDLIGDLWGFNFTIESSAGFWRLSRANGRGWVMPCWANRPMQCSLRRMWMLDAGLQWWVRYCRWT